jgi:hypothetical protein
MTIGRLMSLGHHCEAGAITNFIKSVKRHDPQQHYHCHQLVVPGIESN